MYNYCKISIHYYSQAFFHHPFLVFFFETSSFDSNGDPRRQILVSSRRIIPWKFLLWMTKTKRLKWSLPAYAANGWPRRWVSPTRISWDEALLPLTSTLMVNWISAKWRNYWGLENPAWRTMRLKPFLRRWISDLETFIKHITFLGCFFCLEGSLWRDVAIRKFEKEKHVLLEPPKWLKMAGKPSSLFCSEPGSQLSKFVELIDFHWWKNPLAFVLEILCHIICPQIIFSWTVQSLVFPTCILSSTKIGAEESQQSDQFQWTCLLGLFWKSQRFWESSLPQKSVNIAIQTRCGSVGVFSQLLRNSLVT